MKTTIAAVLAALGLSGCVAVPYDAGPGGYYDGPGYYYGAPSYYYGPPVSFSFGYVYRDGGHRHGRGHGHRHGGHRRHH